MAYLDNHARQVEMVLSQLRLCARGDGEVAMIEDARAALSLLVGRLGESERQAKLLGDHNGWLQSRHKKLRAVMVGAMRPILEAAGCQLLFDDDQTDKTIAGRDFAVDVNINMTDQAVHKIHRREQREIWVDPTI